MLQRIIHTLDTQEANYTRHAAVHFAAIEFGLRHVADWAMFVGRYHDRIDWSALERTAKLQNMDRFLHCLNAISIDFLGVDAAKIPPFERDEALKRRVLNKIIAPEFSVQAPKGGGLAEAQTFKTRRWWANRWKHRIVCRESLPRKSAVDLYSPVLEPSAETPIVQVAAVRRLKTKGLMYPIDT